MRLLIFGKTGQVASELYLQASHANYSFISLDRNQVDVCDEIAVANIIADSDCDVIINATAYTNVDGAESEQGLSQKINADAPYIMAKSAEKKQVPFIHISTDYVFPGDGDQPWKIDDPIDPVNHYGASKAEGERLIATTNGRNIIMRTSWVFSSFGKNFVKTIMRIGAANDELKIVGDQIGGPTSAADIAAAILAIAKQEHSKASQSGTQIMHYSSTPYVSWAQFAMAIAETAEINTHITSIPTSQYPTPAKRPLNSRLDLTELAPLYGLKAPDWGEALDDCIKRIKHNDQT